MTNIKLLRELLTLSGFEVYGGPSPIVCVKMGSEGVARLVSRKLHKLGLVANLVEFPAVPKGQARFRMQVMANHTPRDVIDAVHRLGQAYEASIREYEAIVNAEEASRETWQPSVEEAPAAEPAPVLHIRKESAPEETVAAIDLQTRVA